MSQFDETQRDEYRKAQQRKKRRTATGSAEQGRTAAKRRPAESAERSGAKRRSAEGDARSGAKRRPAEGDVKTTAKRRTAEGDARTSAKRRPAEGDARTTAKKRTAEGDARTAAKRRKASGERPVNAKQSANRTVKGRTITEEQRARAREIARKRQARSNRVSRNVGLVMTLVQAIASVVFMVALFVLDMLPNIYLMVISIVLLLICGIILVSQFFSKKKAISGKVISVIISLLLLMGSYYIFKTTGALKNITGGDYKLDNVVVAVLTDDEAEVLADAADYTFGVQYKMKGSQIEDTVEAINEELGIEIETVEFDSVSEQAVALQNGEVDAIIYNEGYTSVLEEELENYASATKVIYTHSIKSELVNLTSNVAVDEEPFIVYISGIDVYGEIETTSRSDVNILAVVNPKSHQILLVSTPRDYYVVGPGYTDGMEDKLAHIAIHGVDASIATLEALYDMEIDFYARVNFTSLIEIVDALGGVNVYSSIEFTTSNESGYVMQVEKGMNHFNGKQALAFCRERKNLAAGDNQRGKHQQAVITGMISKLVSPAILLGANDIIDSVSGNVDTNMSMDQLQALIKKQLKDEPTWTIKSMSAEGYGDRLYCHSYSGGPLYVTVPDEDSVEAIKEAIDMVQNGEPLDDETVIKY